MRISRFPHYIFTALVSLTSAQAISPGDLSRLVLRSPSPAAGTYSTLTVRGDTLIAATTKGEIISSRNHGATWAPSALLTFEQNGLDRTINFNSSAASPNEWMVLSQEGRWARSTNLINWTTGQGGGASSGLVFAEGLFVSSTFGGNVETSPTGEVWSNATVPAGVTRLDGIAYGGGTFVAAGRQSLVTSPDGLTWTDVTVPVASPEWFETVSWLDGMFYAMGREGLLLTSPDGLTWTKRNLGTNQSFRGGAIAEPPGSVSLHNNGTLFTLNETLTAVTEIDLPSGFQNMAQTEDGGLVGVGIFARLYRKGPGNAEWEDMNETLADGFDSVAFGNDTFVIISTDGRIFSSTDGTEWVLRAEHSEVGFRSEVFFDGTQFYLLDDDERAWRSADAITWTQTQTDIGSLRTLRRLNNLWVVGLNDGSVAHSVDGLTWTAHDVPGASSIQDVAYGEGVYVAVAFSENLYTSPDLVTWTTRSIANSDADNFSNVEFGNGRFVAFKSFGVPALSEDGINWTQLNSTRKVVANFGTGFDSELGFYTLHPNERVMYWLADSTIDDEFIDGARYASGITPSAMASGNGVLVMVGGSGLLMSTPVSSDAYDAWVLVKFGPGTSDAVSGINRDPEGDGVSNLEEYARGTNPLDITEMIPVTFRQTAFGPELTYVQRSGLNDVNATIQYSTDLEFWSSFNVTREIVDLEDGTEEVTARAVGYENAKEIYLRATWEFVE